MHWIAKALLWVGASIALLASFIVAWLSLPLWGTPAAKLWYGAGFDEAVTVEIAKLPGADNACIFDDTRNMFVASPQQLNVEKMVRNALRDRTSIRRPSWRDPHFRVYSGGRTFYWSFRDKSLHGFRGDRFSLAATGERLCKYYRQSPHSFIEAFRSRNDIGVSEENFCCGIEPQPD